MEALLHAQCPLHALDLLALLVGDQRHHGAGAPGPAGAARAVDVVGVIRRRIEVDDAGQVVDVDPPGHHIGGHQGIRLPLGEGVESPLALALGAVAVHRDGPHSLGLQLADDPVGAPLGAAEHEGLPVLRRPAWP